MAKKADAVLDWKPEQRKEFAKLDVKNPARFCDHADLGGGVFRARVHTRPKYYADSSGILLPIDSAFVVKTDRNDCTANTFEITVQNNGTTRAELGKYYLEYTPIKKQGGAAKPPIVITDAGKSDTIRHGTAWEDADVEVQFQNLPGTLKETIIVAKRPAAPSAFLYAYNSNLTPTLEGGRIVWRDGGLVVFRNDELVVVDADEKNGPAHYSLDSDSATLEIVPDFGWMQQAAYPVSIDPTTTTEQAGCTANVSLRDIVHDGEDDEYERAYIRFALPELDIDTMSAATLYLYQQTGNAGFTVTVYCSNTASWTEATGYATIDALSFDASTGSTYISSATGWKTWNVLGATATNGLMKVYEDSTTPGYCTVKLQKTASAVEASSAVVVLGINAISVTTFYPRTNATYYPYLEFTYTLNAGAPTTRIPRQGCGSLIF